MTSASDTQAPAYIWSYAEPAVGVICACLPVLRPLFVGLRDHDTLLLQSPRIERSERVQGKEVTHSHEHMDRTLSV